MTQSDQQLVMPKNQGENDFDIYYQSRGKRSYLASSRHGSRDNLDERSRSRPNTPDTNQYLDPRQQV